ncbi:MAG: hypothetical protein PHO26_01000 [Dehalococcoidia bacterium]|nr:hypothetical protein [Dehalococcoidia bacterium]MDD5493667.1 hypothetical protein [Dehalococcoidia bacterium]
MVPVVIALVVLGAIGGFVFATNGAVFKWFTPPVITSFDASPSSISSGESATLGWDAMGATSVSINPDVGTVSSNGTTKVSPIKTTTYILTATNLSGTANKSTIVTVAGPAAPNISSFTANPVSITAGQSATLSWNVTGATSVSISPDIGTVSSTGSKAVSPAATTSYILTATNDADSASASTTITVTGSGLPTISSFTASPTSVTSGNTATLSWNVTGATSVSISPNIGTVLPGGTYVVTPAATTTYTLTATSSGGNSTATATVTITDSSLPVITAFTATPGTVTSGLASKLQWTVTGATSVSISPNIGAVSASDSKQVYPTENTTYTLTATNSIGSDNATATVIVAIASSPPVINSFTASPTTISFGGSSYLTWSITGATSISIDQGIGTPVLSFGQTVSPTENTTYTLTANNSAGSDNATVTITVNP